MRKSRITPTATGGNDWLASSGNDWLTANNDWHIA
jgi:hypothetical protein